MPAAALHSNPSTTPQKFWGRETTIGQVSDVLRSNPERPDARICLVHGEPGSGKSALLLHIRERLHPEYPDARIYLNSKYLEDDPLRLEKILAKIIHALSPYALLVDDPEELRALYFSALEGKRILILLDDLFSPELLSYLTPPASCALLVTADNRLASPTLSQIAVAGLATDDAEELLLKPCPRIGAFARSLAASCRYQPLLLRLAAGYLNANAKVDVSRFLDELSGVTNQTTDKADSGAILEYLIAQSYALQSPRTREQLRRLGILRCGFTRGVAGMLMEGAADEAISERELQESLDNFVSLGFLNLDDQSKLYQMHPNVQAHVVSRTDDADAIWLGLAAAMARQLGELERLAQSSSDGFVLSLSMFQNYEMCLDEILGWARANPQIPQAVPIPFNLVGFARLFGRLKFLPKGALVPWFQDALEYAVSMEARAAVLALLTDLERVHRYIGDRSKARAYSELRAKYEQREVEIDASDRDLLTHIRRLRAAASDSEPAPDASLSTVPLHPGGSPFNMGKANIVLTGFMGSGKTTVGKQLAELLGYQFVDTDELIEAREGRSISDIFAGMGEVAFRQIERDIALELSTQEKLVISTGGRLMLDPQNVEALSRYGRVFCLVATPQELLSRVSNDSSHKRPLLAVPNPEERIVELLQERSDKYRRFPQVITDQVQPADVAQNLLQVIATDPKHFIIDQTSASYGFIVGAGLLPFFRQLAELSGPAVVVTESQVRELYGPCFTSVERIIELSGDGKDKNLATAEKVYEQLLEIGFDRTGTIISLGGSAVGDVAGFVAATYMRGVNLVHCPTSLIAMIDTSIGGKTGLDLPDGKNIIGVYKQPGKVIADVTTLQTLPPRAFASGMAEVIKHGLLAKSDLLEQVEKGMWNSPAQNPHLYIAELQTLVAQAIQVKISIVQEDPFEQGRRSTLNLGHTFGYAIERTTRNAFTHGECVGLGLVAAANLSARLGYLEHGMQRRIEAALQQFNLPIRIPGHLSPDSLLQAMRTDKKKQGQQIHFILLRGIGDVFVAHNVPPSAILDTLRELTE